MRMIENLFRSAPSPFNGSKYDEKTNQPSAFYLPIQRYAIRQRRSKEYPIKS
jgi:hypothetical protein